MERLTWISKYHPRRNPGRSAARSRRNDLPEIQSAVSLRHFPNSSRQHLHWRRLHPRYDIGCPSRNTPDTVTVLELPSILFSSSLSSTPVHHIYTRRLRTNTENDLLSEFTSPELTLNNKS